jgi:hypothetical protein
MTYDELVAAKNELQKALYSGTLEVRFGERWMKYQSTGDLQKALSDLNNKITTANAPTCGRSMSKLGQFNG